MVPELSSPPNVGRYLDSSQAIMEICRSVAQPGSAPALGAGGPRFESLYSDHFSLVTIVTPLKAPSHPHLGTIGCNPLLVQALLGVVLLCR